jgi:ankyrin repeat protein
MWNVEAVKDLVGLGADVNGKDRSGTTPVHLAVVKEVWI